jgi:hypothetical protein
MDELKQLYREVSSNRRAFPNFPYNRCQDVSRFVVEQLPHRRLEHVWFGGFFMVDKSFVTSDPLYIYSQHGWATTPEGDIVELTGWQFNEWLLRPLPRKPLIIKPDDELYSRYSIALNVPAPYKYVSGVF